MKRGRVPKVLTAEQLRQATLEWNLHTVQPNGRVIGASGWACGEDADDGSQDALLRFEGRKVRVGTNPFDRTEPATIWNPEDGRIIVKRACNVVRGRFDDAEGARRAIRPISARSRSGPPRSVPGRRHQAWCGLA